MTWVVEIKGPNGVKQVEISDELVQTYCAVAETNEYTTAAFLAAVEMGKKDARHN